MSKPGEQAAKNVIAFVNSYNGGPEWDQFVNTILNNHRTLQQNVMRLFMKLIEGWSLADSDLRNEATINLAKEIMEKVPDQYLPFI